MIHEIIVPENNTYLLKLPDELVGKQVEVIAFEVSNKKNPPLPEKRNGRKQYENAIAFFKKYAIDFSTINKWSREDLYD